MKKLFNFSSGHKLSKKGGINPDRDWLILLVTFTLLALVTGVWLAVDYSYLWQVGDVEVIKTEIAKKTTINQTDLGQAISILDRRVDRFDSLYKTAPKVVDPSL